MGCEKRRGLNGFGICVMSCSIMLFFLYGLLIVFGGMFWEILSYEVRINN